MTQRVHNFSAGPAALPEAVLEQAQREMLDYAGTGMSVMEMSHRSGAFIDIASRAEQSFRQLLSIPEHYHVLFLQGGATAHFAAIPMNLLGDGSGPTKRVDYINTGAWSVKAIKEAGKYADVNVAASSEGTNFDRIPEVSKWQLSDNAAYLHLCSNETIGGVQFHEFPDSDVPVVADMSSDILSRPLNVNDFGVIYAGAQKNIGPAGLTLVVVREDLLGDVHPLLPTVLNYKSQAAADSMSNTPPTYGWYLAGLVFDWLLANGGVVGAQERNARKASKLYGAIEASNYYRAPVQSDARSQMNVPFTLANADQDKAFVTGAEARGLMNLKGHRSVGGMRASLYNAVTEASVDALIDYMQDFEREHG